MQTFRRIALSIALLTCGVFAVHPAFLWQLAGSVCLSGAYDMDGTDDYISVADDDSLSFGDSSTDSPFSISAWVNMDDATTFRIAGKTTATVPEYIITFDGSDKLRFVNYDGSSSISLTEISDVAYTSLEGTWAHIVGTYDGSGLGSGFTVSINGSPVASSNTASGSYVAMHNTSGTFNVGDFPFGAGSFADGKISDVRLYSEALTATEISDLYTYGRNPDATNLEGWWEMDGNADDSTANGNDGTVSGAVNTTDPADLPDCAPR